MTVAEPTTGGAITDTSEQGTEYLVFASSFDRPLGIEGEEPPRGGAVDTWRKVGAVIARSTEAAIRKYAEGATVGDRGLTLVAVASSRWSPVKVTERVERTLVIGS